MHKMFMSMVMALVLLCSVCMVADARPWRDRGYYYDGYYYAPAYRYYWGPGYSSYYYSPQYYYPSYSYYYNPYYGYSYAVP